jgi:hypothetical protein
LIFAVRQVLFVPGNQVKRSSQGVEREDGAGMLSPEDHRKTAIVANHGLVSRDPGFEKQGGCLQKRSGTGIFRAITQPGTFSQKEFFAVVGPFPLQPQDIFYQNP